MAGSDSSALRHGSAAGDPSSSYKVIGPEQAVVLLDTVLASTEGALVAAINGFGIQVPIPSSLETHGATEISGTIHGMIPPAETLTAMMTFERARQRGAARCRVHLVTDGNRPADYQLYNLLATHDVIIRVLLPLDLADEVEGRSTLQPERLFRPRFCTVTKDDMSVLVEVDEAFTAMFGFEPSEVLGTRALELIHPGDHKIATEAWMHMLANPQRPWAVKLRHRHAAGDYVWVEIVNHNHLDQDGVVRADTADISDQMAAHEALAERERLLHRLAEALPVGVLQLDAARNVTYANDFIRQLLQVEELQHLEELLPFVAEGDCDQVSEMFSSALGEGVDVEAEIALDLPRHRICSVMLRGVQNEDGQVTAAIACISDITAKATLQRELHHQATYDPLTGAANRASTLRALEAALTDPPAAGVVFVDLDQFKPVNDELGHAVGDELLAAVVARLEGVSRETDTVGRFGGDEFLLVVPGVTSDEAAEALGLRVAGALREPVALSSGPFSALASFGVAWTTDPAVGADELIARADMAMYESKTDGAGQPVLWQPQMEEPSA